MKIDTMLSLQQHTSALVKKNRIHNLLKIYYIMSRYFIRNH